MSPLLQDVNASPNEEIQGRSWIFRWSNVDFPTSGRYKIRGDVDDRAIIRVDGQQVAELKIYEGIVGAGELGYGEFNASVGKRNIEIELFNIRVPDSGFSVNPVRLKFDITTEVSVASGISEAWSANPMGISAILIPPPCPKEVVGKGRICKVIVDDPGNGYPIIPGPGYPATLRLAAIEVVNPGINYNCGVDEIKVTPSNGIELSYECDTFGRITRVNVDVPAIGYTTYPEITMPSLTGVNVEFRPIFEVIRDPIAIVEDEDKLIQVTDLVGLKQTGYYRGRPYYGAVFYKDGVRYAGLYETPGQLIQVYDTLQESIDAQVTTPPSAIQRQGTDIRSNDPRLNIPGTPENLI